MKNIITPSSVRKAVTSPPMIFVMIVIVLVVLTESCFRFEDYLPSFIALVCHKPLFRL
jgi:hypothetical protein